MSGAGDRGRKARPTTLRAAARALGGLALLLWGGAAAPASAQSGARDDSLLEPAAQMSCRRPGHSAVSYGVAGGRDADLSEFPFIVQVKVGKSRCGGALIAPGFALTAAHCVMPPPERCGAPVGGAASGRCALAPAGEIFVVRPGPSGQADGAFRGVKRVFAHPKFSYPVGETRGALDADVAILVLDREFDIGLDKVVNVADPLIDRSFAQGGACARVAGWGRTDVLDDRNRVVTAGKQTRKLQALNLRVLEQERCRARYPGLVSDNMLCAGDGIEGFNTCKGDSGGPLVVDIGQPTLVGLVSWAFGCAQAEHYTVFTRVGAPEVRRWINQTITGRPE